MKQSEFMHDLRPVRDECWICVTESSVACHVMWSVWIKSQLINSTLKTWSETSDGIGENYLET